MSVSSSPLRRARSLQDQILIKESRLERHQHVLEKLEKCGAEEKKADREERQRKLLITQQVILDRIKETKEELNGTFGRKQNSLRDQLLIDNSKLIRTKEELKELEDNKGCHGFPSIRNH
jgi:hypothetical protein